MERLARTKIRYQNQLAQAKEEMLQAPKSNVSPGEIDDLLKKAAARVANGERNGNVAHELSSLNINNNNNKRHNDSKTSVITSTGSSPVSSTGSPSSVSSSASQHATAIPTSVVVANQAAMAALVHGIKSEDEDGGSDTNGDVIVELETGEEYDDETTTTASGNCIAIRDHEMHIEKCAPHGVPPRLITFYC